MLLERQENDLIFETADHERWKVSRLQRCRSWTIALDRCKQPREIIFSVWWDYKSVVYIDCYLEAEPLIVKFTVCNWRIWTKHYAITSRIGKSKWSHLTSQYQASNFNSYFGKIVELWLWCFSHTPYTSDLAQSDFHLFWLL